MSNVFRFGRGQYDRISSHNKRKKITDIEEECSPPLDNNFESADLPDCFDIGSLISSGEETPPLFDESNFAPIEDPIPIEIEAAIDYNQSNFTYYLRAAKLIQGELDMNVRKLKLIIILFWF